MKNRNLVIAIIIFAFIFSSSMIFAQSKGAEDKSESEKAPNNEISTATLWKFTYFDGEVQKKSVSGVIIQKCYK